MNILDIVRKTNAGSIIAIFLLARFCYFAIIFKLYIKIILNMENMDWKYENIIRNSTSINSYTLGYVTRHDFSE